ncbi:hypothetical protein AB0K09_26615 [Streptomyces sp. NPDC049577]|uniref:effector-associated constant component EACC1 n=1 Tax=Streptomyces sp. NPDC049577 TaxID=3155153 RepID=UPI003441731C
MPETRPGYRISIIDDDPLRARREVRELLTELAGADPGAALDVPGRRTTEGADKGGVSAETVGLVLSAGALATQVLQTWMTRVPQRTIVARRPDGATLRITGKEAREDDELIERFLAGDESSDAHGDEDCGTTAS